MKRRTFIKNASLLGASALLPIPYASAEKKSLGVALVGLGTYSTHLLAPALQLTKHCHLAGIVTGSEYKIPKWQKDYGVKESNIYSYDTMSRIANNDEIDIIYIVLPTALHAEYAIKAAETGKHVWCEKPMAMNVKECQQMIDVCKHNKVHLSIGYRMQHEPNTQTVIDYAQTKPYGEIKTVKALAGYYGGGGTDWRFQKKMGGGALYDMGVYTINGIRHAIAEEPIEVRYANQSTKRPEIFKEVDETTEYELLFSSGKTAYGRTSVGENINLLRIDCAKGWYELSPMQSYSGVKGRTSDGKLLNTPIKNQQAKQMDDDALSILEGRPLLVPGIDGLRDIRIVEAILQSAATKKSVKI